VTLQTLDDKSFDHGKILLQTPPINLHQLGLHKPTYSILQDVVTTHAQKLLVQGIRERVFVPPIHDISSNANEKDLIFARKLKAKDAEIDWSNSSTQIAKQYRAMGPLWATMRRENGSTVRVKLDDIEEVPRSDMHTKGRLQIIGYSEKTLLSFSALKDGSIVLQRESKEIANQGTQAQEPDLRIGKMTLEAKSRVAARMAAEGLKVDDR
jgi:methionyl-tRNA formyltransferase